ncbi:GNAT family N-acetyltransferase [Brachionus plicatilis]|uniref:GNAT family N-acetyltransferase n=1 Tax=Brachionus plicatilis TaxID=10195 RepID=A0A3M7PB17_BRAPC|nr:GNAT family N-acetyltransferase [Brachionus plicatilis]
MYFCWISWIQEILESDISFQHANKTYKKDKNVFFTAFHSSNALAGFAGLLIDKEKNVFTDSIVSTLKENEALLIRVCTLPKYQKNGIAKACISKCIEFAKENNVTVIKLVSTSHQIGSIELYKRFGFTVEKIEPYNKFFEFDIYLMKLVLNDNFCLI